MSLGSEHIICTQTNYIPSIKFYAGECQEVSRDDPPQVFATEPETPKEKRKRQIRNRMVYNDWGLYDFVQMLAYTRLRFGNEFYIISKRDTTKMCHVCKHKQDMPLWKRTYYCVNCGLVMDRDENSAVNIYQRFVTWPGPHTQL